LILQRVILDVMHDTAVTYSSNDFFTKRKEIQLKLKDNLVKAVRTKTDHIVEFFQLRSLSLPTMFEREIQNTEVKGQDIETALAEIQREVVKFETMLVVAKSARKEILERAYATANQTEQEARAIESTIKDVVTQ